MKKLIKKLVLFTIISSLVTSIQLSVTMADNGEEQAAAKAQDAEELEKLQNALWDVYFEPCIDEEGDDDGYIVTIIEEPLTLEEEGKTPDDDYVTRICYRNYFMYTDKEGKGHTLSELSTICSIDITDFDTFFGSKFQKEYNIKYDCQPVQVLLSKGGTSLIEGYIGSIYRYGASMAGIIAVLVIIFSGIQISASGGDPQAIETAKKRIIKSLAGIVVLFLSGLILYTINPNFFVR